MAEEIKQANPAPLGLVGFGFTTVMLSLINAGVLPKGGEQVVLPLAFAFGGLIQILAGLLEFKGGNTFGMVAFLSYGAFWWWFTFLVLLGGHGVLDLSQAGSTIAVALLGWGVFTLYMWVATFKLNKALWWVFLTLWITFFLLGFGALLGVSGLSVAGGWVGVLCGLIAVYTSFALVTNITFNRTVLPLGAPISD
ncbi:MAG TPA: acetate uptake transporter [Eoetvoesiella sp.]|uniref:acetate uptake transporter n=1 Tax=Eoetvoesiella sp. TaxID=1966355 RepID=UPI002C3E2480|nr:acetate uptake transporter [Eoetvoesiella sp.]HWK62347.1 acetate uptake transporter [Eoetvoesiella sp.]